MQELFDSIAAELKAEFISFKTVTASGKNREAKIRGLATIAALAGSLRTITVISDACPDLGGLSNPEIIENADKVVVWCISQCK